MTVKEWTGRLVFLARGDGAGNADRSYGVQWAARGAFGAVVEGGRGWCWEGRWRRARRESGGRGGGVIDDLPLFAAAPPAVAADVAAVPFGGGDAAGEVLPEFVIAG